MPPLRLLVPPPFQLTQNTVFGTSRYAKTTDKDVKRNNAFKHNSRLTFLDSLRICWQSTAVHKCDATTRLIIVTRLYGCVAKERYKTAVAISVLR